MKAKKIIERVFKVINVIMNIVMGWAGLANLVNRMNESYTSADELNRMAVIVWMIIAVNVCDYFIRKRIKEF